MLNLTDGREFFTNKSILAVYLQQAQISKEVLKNYPFFLFRIVWFDDASKKFKCKTVKKCLLHFVFFCFSVIVRPLWLHSTGSKAEAKSLQIYRDDHQTLQTYNNIASWPNIRLWILGKAN